MLIDVIIPTYNRCGLLPRAIESVLKQTHQEFILHIVDDGSTDETKSVVDTFSQHQNIRYHYQSNKGVSAARNLAISQSEGAWISFLDSDDEWLPHKLKAQLTYLNQNPSCDFIHSNEIWIRHGIRVNPKSKFDKSSHELFRRSLELCLISPSTVMLKRELINLHGGFDESFEVCEDYDLWLKILAEKDVGFITDNLIKKYGGHEDQLSTKNPAMDYWRIRSLVKLQADARLPSEKREWVLSEIKKKASVLIQGYSKHLNTAKVEEINEMMKALT